MQRDDAIGRDLRLTWIEHQVFNGLFVVQDHLGFQRGVALSGLAEFDESLGVEPAVGVAQRLGNGLYSQAVGSRSNQRCQLV